VTVERARTGNKRPVENSVIPFRGADPSRLHPEARGCGPNPVRKGRTLRPVDVLLLLPVIAPITGAILLSLLGWFVCWLAIVALLVTAIVLAVFARAILWRVNPPAIGTGRRAVTYQGH
jgi:hypothetical protein